MSGQRHARRGLLQEVCAADLSQSDRRTRFGGSTNLESAKMAKPLLATDSYSSSGTSWHRLCSQRKGQRPRDTQPKRSGNQARHSCGSSVPEKALVEKHGAEFYEFDKGPFGQFKVKPTCLLIVRASLVKPALNALSDLSYIAPPPQALSHVSEYVAAKVYPSKMCAAIACGLLTGGDDQLDALLGRVVDFLADADNATSDVAHVSGRELLPASVRIAAGWPHGQGSVGNDFAVNGSGVG